LSDRQGGVWKERRRGGENEEKEKMRRESKE